MREMIVAMLPSGIIGNKGENGLLWHIPEELKFFKEQTLGKNVVFGKNTFLSLPKYPLPNRTNIVLTDKKLDLPEDVIQINSIEELNSKYTDYIVCGGGSVYDGLAEHIDYVYVSTIVKPELIKIRGDLRFTAFDNDKYTLIEDCELAKNENFVARRYKVNKKVGDDI